MGMDNALTFKPVSAEIVLTTAESIPPETPTTKHDGFFGIPLTYFKIQFFIYSTLCFAVICF
jgi:hypothetical protein